MSSTSLTGYVWRHAELDRSGFDIIVPVNELTVDDDNARAAQGADFPLNITDEARQGTRENMLSEAQLDGAHFPFIGIRSISMSGSSEAPLVMASLQIRHQTRAVPVPVALAVGDNTLRISGEFEIKQSGFGITPFSVALGALRVLDVLKIKFELVATRI